MHFPDDLAIISPHWSGSESTRDRPRPSEKTMTSARQVRPSTRGQGIAQQRETAPRVRTGMSSRVVSCRVSCPVVRSIPPRVVVKIMTVEQHRTAHSVVRGGARVRRSIQSSDSNFMGEISHHEFSKTQDFRRQWRSVWSESMESAHRT